MSLVSRLRRPERWMSTCIAMAPVVVVIVAHMAVSPGPRSAHAGSAASPVQEESAVPPTTVEPMQREAKVWFGHRRDRLDQIRSPMYRPPEPEPGIAPVLRPAPEPETADRPTFRVTAIIGSGERAMASINGQMYRQGDMIAGGWRINAIDARVRSVQLEGPAGERATVRVKIND